MLLKQCSNVARWLSKEFSCPPPSFLMGEKSLNFEGQVLFRGLRGRKNNIERRTLIKVEDEECFPYFTLIFSYQTKPKKYKILIILK